MSHILVTIIPTRAAALTENFPAVMRELLDSLAARPWRARQASCLAMADLLPGRRWPLLTPTFGELWEVALRVADDIKDSVRVNGERLLRALGNLTQRCDSHSQAYCGEPAHPVARQSCVHCVTLRRGHAQCVMPALAQANNIKKML